jgi:toxin YoeB
VRVCFTDDGWEDYLFWQAEGGTAFTRLGTLIEECRRTPFQGTGKPEPLKGVLQGWWSRRLTGEHRMVYRVEGQGESQQLTVIQARYHY